MHEGRQAGLGPVVGQAGVELSSSPAPERGKVTEPGEPAASERSLSDQGLPFTIDTAPAPLGVPAAPPETAGSR